LKLLSDAIFHVPGVQQAILTTKVFHFGFNGLAHSAQ